MALTLAHVVLPLLVAMAVAAPLAEQTNNEEQVVNINGDSKVVDRGQWKKMSLAGETRGLADQTPFLSHTPSQKPDKTQLCLSVSQSVYYG